MDFSGKKILVLEGYCRQSLPFMRAFRKLGCEITLLCDSKLDCGYASRLPNHKILGVCNIEKYSESEEYIVSLIKTGNYDVVFPLFDFSAKILAYHKEELEKYAVIVANDKATFDLCQDKLQVMRLCQENNIPCPITLQNVKTKEDVERANMPYPFIIKPRCGYGANGFHRFDNKSEFDEFCEKGDCDLSEYVVQECIPEGSLVASANVFIDRFGDIKSSFLYGSHRFFPLKGGTGTFNITFNREDIQEQCKRLMKVSGLRGCVGIDFMIDSRDNVAKIIEINPRVLACTVIGFRAGVNQALQVLEDCFNQTVTEYLDYKCDVRIRMSQTDFLWFLKSPQRFKAKPSWFSCRHTKDQTFYIDDPLPWFAFLIKGLFRYNGWKKKHDK